MWGICGNAPASLTTCNKGFMIPTKSNFLGLSFYGIFPGFLRQSARQDYQNKETPRKILENISPQTGMQTEKYLQNHKLALV